ncbi:MAG: zinc ABC transporter substrate-binding protein [Helicobacteraceae bacterium]|jgi:zinc transport system substrate-binding protein|nr:zinc ABC transporter substrate-binding protein [Helicobacteraceae bacterium]
MIRASFLIFALLLYAEAKIIVAVSVSPQAWLANQIGGDRIETLIILPANASPHVYEPKVSHMIKLAKASLYLACGVEFEKAWLKRFAQNAPNMQIVYTDRNVTKLTLLPFADENRTRRREAVDSHIWTSAQAMRSQALATIDALIAVDSQNEKFYRENGAKTIAKIDALRAELTEKLAPYKNRAFLIHHPSLGYFANEYELRQIFIEFEGREPKPFELAAIAKIAKDENITAIFVERGVSPKTARSLGVKTVEIATIGEDWEALMRLVAQEAIRVFDGGD